MKKKQVMPAKGEEIIYGEKRDRSQINPGRTTAIDEGGEAFDIH